ncbi:glomulin-like [Styela clava]
MSSSQLTHVHDGEDVENSNSFQTKFQGALGNPEKLWDYINENKEAETVIRPVAWELIGSTISFLRENAISENLKTYEKCLEKIAGFAVPKDVYLGILEQFDPSIESMYVELLMPALSNVLEKLALNDIDACITVLETTFSTLSYYLESLNIPKYEDFDPTLKRTKKFEAQKIESFISKYIDLLNPVVREIYSKNNQISSNILQFESYMFQFLCNLLIMLGQVDLDEPLPDKENDSIRENVIFPGTSKICCDVMLKITHFHSPNVLWHIVNWYKLQPAEERSMEAKFEIVKQVDRARACYVFLLLCRGLLYDQFPKVYSSQCLLVFTCISLNTLLSCENQCVAWKGLETLSFILNQTSDSSISCGEVVYNIKMSYGSFQGRSQSLNPILDVFKNLISIAVMLPSKTIRSTAIQHVTKLLNLFRWEDKYSILVHLLRTTDHNGVQGVLIGYLKDRFNEILQEISPKNSLIFCEAHKMSTLGELIFLLPQGTETDLLEDCDRLMPALNLFRFLLIRDKTNKTGILDHLDKLDTEFLKPLRNAIDLSRAHYENELKKYDRSSKRPDDNKTEFLVNGTPLPTLPYKEQKRTLEAALHTFDMIEIVTIRVIELIDVSYTKHNSGCEKHTQNKL